MNLYKVVESGKGFTVWKVSEKSGGRAYESTGQRFDTREAAQEYIRNERGVKNEETRKE